MSRHESLAPKIQDAIRGAVETTVLSSSGRILPSTLRTDAGFHCSSAEYDVETLISAISEAVGRVLVREEQECALEKARQGGPILPTTKEGG